MNNELDINIFSNKGNFNLKLNPLCRPKGNYQLLALLGNGLLGSLSLSTPLLFWLTDEIPSQEVINLIKIY